MQKLAKILLPAFLSVMCSYSYAQAPAPTDAQIAGIVVAANNVDIEAGKLANSVSQNKDVKGFAQLMITDHTNSNKQATALVTKLNVKPEESDTSRSLKNDGKTTISKLKGLKGKEFDKAYVDSEVTYHQAVLDAIDKTLIPNAKNAELKGLLEKTRPVIEAHLQHAKNLKNMLM
ncbi:MAG TPA: DUF4142 domain-containing protein [Methylophilaceae bacterium]|nr:DUF4142 domain-containing protein [Methylophilaceae bacterium]